MMKKILLLTCAVLAILFTGCKQLTKNNTDGQHGNAVESTKTVLKISNQSSRHIVDVTYDGINFDTGELRTVKCLPTGQSSVKTFSEEANSYIRFTVYSKEYTEESGWIGKKYEVRTNELVALEKGKTNLFTLTDNTLIVVKGSTVSVTLAKLYDDATTVSIKNETSRMLKNVTFNEKIFSQEKGEFNKGAAVIQSFTDACEGYVYFTIHARDHETSNEKADTDHGDNYNCAVYDVRTKEKFSVKKYESKEIIIDDATEVVKIGETDDDSITVSKLLKNNTLVKIENAATRPLIEVKYGFKDFTFTKSSGGENNYCLPINKYVEKDFDDGDINEYIVFNLPWQLSENYKGVKVRTAEKIFVKRGTAKEIRITDKTMVVKEGENEPVVLSSLFYNTTKLTIVNNSSRALYTATKNEELVCSIGGSNQGTIGDYGASWKTNIVFKLYARSSNTGTSYKVRTHELFELTADVPKSITVDDNTLVVVEGTTEAVTIASLLDNVPPSHLTILNRTTRKIGKITYADKDFTSNRWKPAGASDYDDYLAIGEQIVHSWESDTEDFISFVLYSRESGAGKCYKVKMQDKLSLPKGTDKSIILDNNTLVVVEGTTEAVTIASLLDNRPAGKLTIQNNTSRALSSGKFGKLSNFNIGIGQNTVLACEEDTTDYVSVEMYARQEDGKPHDASIGVVCYTFKIDEKMSVAVGEEKILIITDSTLVRVADKSSTISISSLLDSTAYGYLIIQNHAYSEKYGLHWANCLYENLGRYKSLIVRIGSAGVDDYIHWYADNNWYDYSKKRTTERVTANAGETKTFTITDTTQIVGE